MAAVPDAVDTTVQPPLRVPLRHFLVALALLVPASACWIGAALGAPLAGLAGVHLLLAGWICLTIAGAMTQFVPVWAGVPIHSIRLARAHLVLLAVGVLGVAAGVLVARFDIVALAGVALLAGLWALAYNVGRTLLRARPLDVTEGHFAFALACFAVLPLLGLLLAGDYAGVVAVPHAAVLGAHATLAVFGAVGATVFGALYQLATIFAQVDLDRFDRAAQRVESTAYPLGVVLLAAGRLLAVDVAARIGGVLVAASVLLVAVVLARCLARSRVAWTPMLRRYAFAAVAFAAWAVLSLPAWAADARGPATRFGAPHAFALLVVGAVGFVVLGTLYHVVPFLVWTDRYADRLGLETVPTLDDLYDDRSARVDFALTGGGAALWAGGALAGVALAVSVGTVAFAFGGALAAANLARVVWRHSPGALAERFARERDAA
ncbi:MAG: hypothetical protein ABEJ80_07530 [Halarchaeum sp.]